LEPKDIESSIYDGYYIKKVLHHVKSGKEADVYCCEAYPHVGTPLLAAKVYRPLETRGFRRDSLYQEGRFIKDRRLRKAFQDKSKAGRSVQLGMWVSAEYETICLLHEAGAHVPKPYAQSGNTIIMDFIGDKETPAPTLNRVHLPNTDARKLFDILAADIEIGVSCGRIHGDLSPFNILYWDNELKIIDFPQSVDPEENAGAFTLLHRDMRHVVDYFSRYGIRADAFEIARGIWERHIHWTQVLDRGSGV
jgi:RIO kinase 1